MKFSAVLCQPGMNANIAPGCFMKCTTGIGLSEMAVQDDAQAVMRCVVIAAFSVATGMAVMARIRRTMPVEMAIVPML